MRKTIDQIANMLEANQVVEIFGDGNQLIKKTKTDEILSANGNMGQWLKNLQQENNVKDVLLVKIGKANGNTWKNPIAYIVDINPSQLNGIAPAAQYAPQTDHVLQNAMPSNGDSSEMLKAKLWAITDKYAEMKEKFTEMKADKRILEADLKAKEKELRQIEIELEDLQRSIEKGSFIDKIMENPEVMGKLAGLLDRGPSQGQLEGPGLSEVKKRVITTVTQNDDDTARMILHFLFHIQKPEFYEQYSNLLAVQQSPISKTN